MVFGFPVFVLVGFKFHLHIKFNDDQYLLATSASSFFMPSFASSGASIRILLPIPITQTQNASLRTTGTAAFNAFHRGKRPQRCCQSGQ